jgi:hypothetical protein
MSKQLHLVEDGFVYCLLRRKDVDIESCFGCSKLHRIDLDSRHPYVVCDVPPLLDLSPAVPA